LVLESQGKYEEAETMNRWALAEREAALWHEHPDMLTSDYCLTYLLQRLEKHNGALILCGKYSLG
jgi:hypothetical protein